MILFAVISLPIVLGVAAAAGLLLGVAVNWATYWLSWNRRHVSPWSPPHADAPPRRASDRAPLIGWFGLRREHVVHGPRFWVRPLVVEFAMAVGTAALAWWEFGRLGLVRGQFAHLAGAWPPDGALAIDPGAILPTLAAHALLVALMAAASLIDIDEKTIPDGITVYGTLAALVLAAWSPFALLPQVVARGEERAAVAAPIQFEMPQAVRDTGIDLEPVGNAAPHPLPRTRVESSKFADLAVAAGCYLAWCLALTPRIYRGRHGLCRGLAIIGARVRREVARPPLLWLWLAGWGAIVGVWLRGGPGWAGLYAALVGMLGGGAMVWGVRLVGSWALRREAMGFGDVTLMMMIGAFVGWQACVVIFFLAPLAGLLVGISQILLRRGDEIPYGPFLCLATLAVVVRWADVWNFAAPLFEFTWLVPAALAVCLVLLGAMLVLWRNIKEALFGVPEDER
ncbi:MAG: prepilin peptidase [Pirellulales bacterium]|nr:prepilin peptidase [Pirellulales bacterium]